MMKFKMQHPNDLISRMFMLEYMRLLDTQKLYDACTEYKQKKMFYRFYDEKETEQIDINWEYMLFEATVYELESLLKEFLSEIEDIDAKDKEEQEKIIKAAKEPSIVVPKQPGLIDLQGNEL